MEIYLPIFIGDFKYKEFNFNNEQNPGIGGTQHVTLLLAARLAKAMPKWNLILVHDCEIKLLNKLENIKQKVFSNFNEFFEFFSYINNPSIRAIINYQLLKTLNYEKLKVIAKNSYCWLHHPFSFDQEVRKARFRAYVCVGEYQYFSNKNFYKNCTFIQNIFPSNLINSQKINLINKNISSSLRLIFLGALVPGKGFHLIANQWPQIKENFPNVRLDVIGSINTYSENKNNNIHELIPTSKDYGELIMKYITIEDIKEKRIIFHGNLGLEKEKIIKNAHLALLNPTGNTEAFPASPIECMALGTPVIASDDFGMYDSMKYFPEISLNKPNQIIKKISYSIASQHNYNVLRFRSIAVANMFALNSYSQIWEWVKLINSDSDHNERKEINLIQENQNKFIKLKSRQFKYKYMFIKNSVIQFFKTNTKKFIKF